jgi:streptomycin 6-kinase
MIQANDPDFTRCREAGLRLLAADIQRGHGMNRTPGETALSRAMIRWSLARADEVAETRTSWVHRVEKEAGGSAALKILKPGMGTEEARGCELLRWYAGEGAALVEDQAEHAILMEWLEGAHLGEIVREGRDEAAFDVLCEVIATLHKTRPEEPDDLMPLEERFAPLHEIDADELPGSGRDLFARAKGISYQLLEKPVGERPLHGDLHFDNIVSSPRGWLALDPKGLIGDPAYEAAPAFINPLDMTDNCAEPARIALLASKFSQVLGFKPKRVLGFAVVHAALSACWDIGADKPVTHQMAILPNLLSAYDVA